MGAITSALRQRGHHVTLACSESYRRRVDGACDGFIAIGPRWEEDRLEPGGSEASGGVRDELRNRGGKIASFFFHSVREVSSDLARALRLRPRTDMLVLDYTLLAGAPTAEALGLRWAAVFGLTVPFRSEGWPPFGSHFGFARSPAIRGRYAAIERRVLRENAALYRPLRELWREAGRRVSDPWQIYARLGRLGIVGSIPDCDFLRPARFPGHIHYVGPLIGADSGLPALDREAVALIQSPCDRPLVHLTLGFTFSGVRAVLQTIIAALADEPLRLMVSTGNLDPRSVRPAAGSGRARMLVRRTFPHLETMPAIDLLICHGGANTLMKALYFAVPALVIPLGGEQRSNGARFVHARVGRMLLPSQLNPAAIRREVRGLLDPAGPFQRRAEKLGQAARAAGGAGTAAALLEAACREGPDK
jgi:UDP:flavonoid glycosyltransferase YjiC (YdhE family)